MSRPIKTPKTLVLPSQPLIVSVAAFLYYLVCVGSMWTWKGTEVASLVIAGVLLGLTTLVVHFCLLGRNWARILLAIMGAINLLYLGWFAYGLVSAIGQGKQIGTGPALAQSVAALAASIASIAASVMLFMSPAKVWFHQAKLSPAGWFSRPRVMLATGVALTAMLAIGVARHNDEESPTLPAEVVVDIRNQLAETSAELAKIDDLLKKLETGAPGTRGASLTRGLRMQRGMLVERGVTIYRDVHKRYPQLLEQQRFAVASMIGNALGMNAKYYLALESVSEERGGIITNPGFALNDTSQNLPDPE
ncbi:MAG: hypothetical protein JW940_17905 [Polyangiaceae bacterium]|nr:hypothetical protein [Polyangiaceae bacterium]